MCYQYHAPADIAAVPCPMCMVFKPSAARCPHLRDVCYNRANHPRTDVVHLRNAEVKSFNGCGYCKWARSNPKLTVHNNHGWPGCCRPPAPAEHRLIQPADWPTISIVHGVPMPPDVKSVLDAILARGTPIPRASPDRRNSTPVRSSSSKTPPVPIPPRGRSGGSPVPHGAGTTPRASDLSRRQTYTEGTKDKSRAPSARRHDGSLSRRNPPARSATISSSYSPSRPSETSLDPYGASSRNAFGRTLSSKRSTLETAMAALDVTSSSESSSDSGSSCGSLSDATVISDGAFTDYLSDESDAELQRQAEAKAALVAQNQAEELEFKAARQQLAGVGLRPPKAWDDTNACSHSSYHATVFAPAAVAHSARG